MKDASPPNKANHNINAAGPPDEADRLLAEYGQYLDMDGSDDAILSEAQRKEALLALWQIMLGFVDFGFGIGPGDKFHPKCDLGMDDVLHYLIPEETAHETVASPNTNNNEEQP